jgi:hypothetical protein
MYDHRARSQAWQQSDCEILALIFDSAAEAAQGHVIRVAPHCHLEEQESAKSLH